MTTCEERNTSLKVPLSWSAHTFIHGIAEVDADSDDVTFTSGIIATASGRVRERAHAAFSAGLPVMHYVNNDALVDLRVLPRLAPPSGPGGRPFAAQLGDVIEQVALLLQRAAWLQAGLPGEMPPFGSLSPELRATFRQAAIVAVRKLCVHQMLMAQSQVAPLFPNVNVRDLVQVFDRTLAQEWI